MVDGGRGVVGKGRHPAAARPAGPSLDLWSHVSRRKRGTGSARPPQQYSLTARSAEFRGEAGETLSTSTC